MTAPTHLYFTDDDEANRLLATDPFAFLVGFALDQQITVQQAFLGPLRIKQRLGTLDPKTLATTDLEPSLQGEAGRASLPRLDGAPRPGPRGDDRRGVRRRRHPDLDGSARRSRPARPPRGASRLRRHEGALGRRRAREALRRRHSAGDRAHAPHARRRRLPAGARRTTRLRSARTRPSSARRPPR